MIYTFSKVLRELSKNSNKKILNGIVGSYKDNLVMRTFIILLIITFFCSIFEIYLTIQVIIISIIVFIAFLDRMTRKITFGLAEDSFVYMRLKRIGYKPKKIEIISFSKIKDITYRKLFKNSVKISYIDSSGKLNKINIVYSNRVLGIGFVDHQYHALAITNKIKEIEKELNRGDYCVKD